MRVRSFTTTAAVTAVMGALSFMFAAPALAETNTQIDQSTTVQVADTSAVTVNQQSTSSTTADGVTNTVTSSSSNSDDPQNLTPDSAPSTVSDDKSAATTDENLAPALIESTTAAPIEAPEQSQTAIQQSANSASLNYHYFQSVSSPADNQQPPVQTASVPVGQPTQDQPTNGALHQFDAAIIALVSSSSRQLTQAFPLTGRLPIAAGAVLAIICFYIAAPLVGQYTSRLRRAGFSHAARSDMSGIFNSFGTPLKVSFAWAVSPAASSSFYRSSWFVASGH